MKTLNNIVEFYEGIKQNDFFPGTVFVVDYIAKIEDELNSQNQLFFDLIEKMTSENKISKKSLQISFIKLCDIYLDIEAELNNHLFPKIENTPLFRYEIKFEESLLTKAFSSISILNAIASIYSYLDKYFTDEIKFEKELKASTYIPPYINEIGYIKYIYSKLISYDSLEKEFYNDKNHQICKIDEFLNGLPSDIEIRLPIDLYKRITQNEEDYSESENEPNRLQSILNSAGFLSLEANSIDAFIEKLNLESKSKLNEENEFIKYKPIPLFSISDSFKKDISGYDYTKDFFYSLRDSFKLLSDETKLSEFRMLFEDISKMPKITITDSKKFVAIIKFLKANKIVNPHFQYLKLLTNYFIEPNKKQIEYISLLGSKRKLTIKEEKQLKELFNKSCS